MKNAGKPQGLSPEQCQAHEILETTREMRHPMVNAALLVALEGSLSCLANETNDDQAREIAQRIIDLDTEAGTDFDDASNTLMQKTVLFARMTLTRIWMARGDAATARTHSAAAVALVAQHSPFGEDEPAETTTVLQLHADVLTAEGDNEDLFGFIYQVRKRFPDDIHFARLATEAAYRDRDGR
jgi:hypothetical protein